MHICGCLAVASVVLLRNDLVTANEERRELREIFVEMDTDKTGTISFTEFRAAMENRCRNVDMKIEETFQNIDVTGNDQINYTEFLAATTTMRIREDHIEAAFKRFDKNRSGFIEIENLREVLGDTCTQDEIGELMRRADCNGDGSVSYSDFVSFVRQHLIFDVQLSEELRSDV